MEKEVRYKPLLDQGDDDIEAASNESSKHAAARCGRQFCWWAYQTVLHLTIASLLLHSRYKRRPPYDPRLLPSELRTLNPPHTVCAVLVLTFRPALAAEHIQYETVLFKPSGFSMDGSVTPYEGIPTPEKDVLWRNLSSVGMYSLTESEYEQLPDLDTILVGPNQDQRLVTIEVFHQLHCVDYLRQRVYEKDGIPFNDEQEWSREHHLSHCIDYLRQVLMCHGDVTPITLKWSPYDHRPMPNFEIVHTCRSWDRLYEFALARNISGARI